MYFIQYCQCNFNVIKNNKKTCMQLCSWSLQRVAVQDPGLWYRIRSETREKLDPDPILENHPGSEKG